MVDTGDRLDIRLRRSTRTQYALTDRALLLGDPYIRKLTQSMRSTAISAAKQDGRVWLKDIDTTAAEDEFAGLLTNSFLRQLVEYDTHPLGRTHANLSAYDRQNRQIGGDLELDTDAIGGRMLKLASKQTRYSLRHVKDRINRELQESAAVGEAKSKRVARIKRALDNMGISPANPSYARNLVNTHISLARGSAQRFRVLADSSIDLLVYVTMGDHRVRPEHERLHGITKPKSHPIWRTIWPPNGWGCRCLVQPAGRGSTSTRLPVRAATLVDSSFAFDFMELAV